MLWLFPVIRLKPCLIITEHILKMKTHILKDKRIAKLELGELVLSEEDAGRISQRFGIA